MIALVKNSGDSCQITIDTFYLPIPPVCLLDVQEIGHANC